MSFRAKKPWSSKTCKGDSPFPCYGLSGTVVDDFIWFFGGVKKSSGMALWESHAVHVLSLGGLMALCEVATLGQGPKGRTQHTAVNFMGKIYVFGGISAGNCDDNSVYVLTAKTKAWTRPRVQGEVPSGRYEHSAALDGAGSTMIVTGGKLDGNVITDEVYSLHLTSHNWSKLPSMPIALKGHTSCTVDDTIYVFGGTKASGELSNELFSYDCISKIWSKPAAHGGVSVPRTGAAMGVVDGVLYICGGADPSDRPVGTVSCFNTKTGEWYAVGPEAGVGPSISGRGLAVATHKNKLYVAGGFNSFDKNNILSFAPSLMKDGWYVHASSKGAIVRSSSVSACSSRSGVKSVGAPLRTEGLNTEAFRPSVLADDIVPSSETSNLATSLSEGPKNVKQLSTLPEKRNSMVADQKVTEVNTMLNNLGLESAKSSREATNTAESQVQQLLEEVARLKKELDNEKASSALEISKLRGQAAIHEAEAAALTQEREETINKKNEETRLLEDTAKRVASASMEKLANFKDAANKSEKTIADLEAQLSAATVEIEAARKNTSAASSSIAGLESSLAVKDSILAQTSKDLAASIEKFSALEAKVAQLESKQEESGALEAMQVSNLESEKAKVANLEREVATLRAESVHGEDAAAQAHAHAAKVTRLEEELGSKTHEADQLTVKVAELEKKLLGEVQNSQKQATEVASVVAKAQEVSNQAAAAKQRVQELEAQAKADQTTIEGLRAEVASAQSAQNGSAASASKELEDMRAKLLAAETRVQQSSQEQAKVTAVLAKAQEVSNQAAAAKQRVQELEAQAKADQTTIEGLRAEAASAQSAQNGSAASASKELEDMRAKLLAAETRVQQSSQEQAKVTAVLAKAQEVSNQAAAAKQRVQELEAQAKADQTTIEGLRAEAASAQSAQNGSAASASKELADMRAKLSAAETRTKESANKASSAEQKVTQLQRRVTELEGASQEMHTRQATSVVENGRVKALEQEVATLKQSLKIAEANLANVPPSALSSDTARLKELESEVDSLKSQLAQAQTSAAPAPSDGPPPPPPAGPPGPPPPGPPPPPGGPAGSPTPSKPRTGGRTDLLSAIQKGKSLKKAPKPVEKKPTPANSPNARPANPLMAEMLGKKLKKRA